MNGGMKEKNNKKSSNHIWFGGSRSYSSINRQHMVDSVTSIFAQCICTSTNTMRTNVLCDAIVSLVTHFYWNLYISLFRGGLDECARELVDYTKARHMPFVFGFLRSTMYSRWRCLQIEQRRRRVNSTQTHTVCAAARIERRIKFAA